MSSVLVHIINLIIEKSIFINDVTANPNQILVSMCFSCKKPLSKQILRSVQNKVFKHKSNYNGAVNM